MRFYFLHAGLLTPLEAVESSSRSRPGYMIRTDLGENTQAGIRLPGSSGQHMHGALERDGVPNFVSAVESGRGTTASRQVGN